MGIRDVSPALLPNQAPLGTGSGGLLVIIPGQQAQTKTLQANQVLRSPSLWGSLISANFSQTLRSLMARKMDSYPLHELWGSSSFLLVIWKMFHWSFILDKEISVTVVGFTWPTRVRRPWTFWPVTAQGTMQGLLPGMSLPRLEGEGSARFVEPFIKDWE